MANNVEETITLVRIDTGEAVKTVADLKDYIKKLKDGIQNLTIGTEEYNTTLRALQSAQDAQRDAMNFGVESVKAADTSYNALVHTLRELKQEWRSMEEGAKRDELGKQIATINQQLKDLDATVGVFSRGVGDYRNAIVDASKIIGGPFGSAIDKADKSMKLFSKNPVMVVLMLLAPLLAKIINGFKGSEAATKAWDKAMEALQPVLDLFDKVLNFTVSILTSIVDKFTELASGSKDSFKTVVAGAVGVGNAIVQFLLTPVKTIINAWKGLGEVMVNVFKGDFKKAKDSATLAANGIKDAFTKGFSFKANFEQGKKVGEEFAKGLGEGRAKKAAGDAGKGAAEDRLAIEKNLLELELKMIEEGTQKRLDKQLELRAKEYEIAQGNAQRDIKDKELLNKQLLLLEAEYEKDVLQAKADFATAQETAAKEAGEKAVAEEIQNRKNEIARLREHSAERLALEVELKRLELDTLQQMEGESDAAFMARKIEAEKAVRLAVQAEREQAVEEGRLARENEIAAVKDDTLAKLSAELELKAYELDTLHRLEDESEEAFRARQLAAQNAFNDKQKELIQARVSMYQTWASNISGLMSGIADAYEALSDDEEKAAEETKGLRIAGATIDTISGAVGAFMSAMTSGIPAPYNMVLGALQAATATAMGIANIAKIKATNVKGSTASTAAPAVVSAPPVVQQVPVTRTETSASEEERLDKIAKDQRVVLVYSDVEEAGKYVDVVQDETEF